MKTTLLIMAAGIGFRFGGGIKQLERLDSMTKLLWIIRFMMPLRLVLIRLFL